MIQAVAFDLDDTLLRNDRTLSAYTIRVIRQAAASGIRILLASGRVKPSVLPYAQQLGCVCCCICGNGADLCLPDGHPLMHQTLSPDLAREAVLFALEHDCYVHVFKDHQFLYSCCDGHAEAYAHTSGLRAVRVPDLHAAILQPTPKALLIADADRIDHLLPVAQAQFGNRMSVTRSKPEYMEIVPANVSKGAALRWTAQHFGFSLEQTMAFGDGLNDMSMLCTAGHGVAMGNACREVRSALPHHCLTNEEDGAARYLDHYLNHIQEGNR